MFDDGVLQGAFPYIWNEVNLTAQRNMPGEIPIHADAEKKGSAVFGELDFRWAFCKGVIASRVTPAQVIIRISFFQKAPENANFSEYRRPLEHRKDP